MINQLGGWSCYKCGKWISNLEYHQCSYAYYPAQISYPTTAISYGIYMQKIKLSETEKEELKKIRENMKKTFSDTVDFEFAYDIGWLFGLIDRITE